MKWRAEGRKKKKHSRLKNRQRKEGDLFQRRINEGERICGWKGTVIGQGREEQMIRGVHHI